jgi:hypothetical protein
MRDRYRIIGNNGIHFMTATTVAWIPFFWQPGFHPQSLDDGDIFMQEIDYTHENSVVRGCVDEPDHSRYSSERNWHHGKHSVLRIDDIYGEDGYLWLEGCIK